jgi:hypothetical protein
VMAAVIADEPNQLDEIVVTEVRIDLTEVL